jgi:hypothetical protein
MTKTKSTKITLNLDKRFDALIQRVATWNTGAYKTANDQLYDLLADTYELYLQIVNGDHDTRKQFNNLLKERNVPFQDNTPIQTRVVRLVFAIDRKRAHTYANVLRLARIEKKTKDEVPNWIREKGGVQEVAAQANGTETTAAKAKADAETASDVFAKSDAIAKLGKLPVALKPGETSHPTYSIALIRSEGGATGEIVWGTNNATLITRVLALAGKDLREKQHSETEATKAREGEVTVRAAVKDAVRTVVGNSRPANRTTSVTKPSIAVAA